MIETNEAVRQFAALSQATRLEVLKLLAHAGPAGKAAGDLAAMAKVPPSTLSFHLRELLDAGLIDAERAGRHINYRVRPGAVSRLAEFLLSGYLSGGEGPAWPDAPDIAAE